MYKTILTTVLQTYAVPLSIKTVMYIAWFRRKQYKASVLTCFLLAGMPMIGPGIIHIPLFLNWIIGIGIAVYILSQYTNVEIFPWGVVTIVAVEVIYAFLEKLLIAPLFY